MKLNIKIDFKWTICALIVVLNEFLAVEADLLHDFMKSFGKSNSVSPRRDSRCE